MGRLFTRLYAWPARIQGWAKRRLTPAGRFVLGTLLLAFVLGANVQQTLGYQLTLLLLALLVVAALPAPWFRARLQIQRLLPRYATAGEPFTYRVRISNPGPRTQGGLDFLEELEPGIPKPSELKARLRPGRYRRHFRVSRPLRSLRRAEASATPVPAVPAGGSVDIRPELLPLRRGRLALPGAWLGRADPLGLVRGLIRMRVPDSVLVLPRRYPIRPLALPGQTRYQHGGVSFASGVGESEEFVALRDYRRGDPLRRIHWRSSARVGELVVKEYQDEFFVRHALVLDTFCDPSLDEVFEEAVAVAASFACTVPDQDSLLDLLFVGPGTVCVTAGRGVGHTSQMLEVLAGAEPCREKRFEELAALVTRHCPALSGCILVLLDWDPPRRELVRRLKAMGLPTWVLVLQAPGSETLPAGPAADQPDRFVVAEVGKVGEVLLAL